MCLYLFMYRRVLACDKDNDRRAKSENGMYDCANPKKAHVGHFYYFHLYYTFLLVLSRICLYNLSFFFITVILASVN
jgi:hypothetical protein